MGSFSARKALIESADDEESDKDTETEVLIGENDEDDDGKLSSLMLQ